MTAPRLLALVAIVMSLAIGFTHQAKEPEAPQPPVPLTPERYLAIQVELKELLVWKAEQMSTLHQTAQERSLLVDGIGELEQDYRSRQAALFRAQRTNQRAYTSFPRVQRNKTALKALYARQPAIHERIVRLDRQARVLLASVRSRGGKS